MTENSLFRDEGKWGFLDPDTLFSRKWGFGESQGGPGDSQGQGSLETRCFRERRRNMNKWRTCFGKTGRTPKMGKNGGKIEKGPWAEIGKKWPKNGKKVGSGIIFVFLRHFWAIFFPFQAVGHFLIFLGQFFPIFGVRSVSILYTRRSDSQPNLPRTSKPP